jgi:hypothetical protein
MDERDRELRNLTYRRFVELGRAPRLAELAAEVGIEPDELAASWRRLYHEHALVLDPTGEIRMAAPFSAVPTPHRVRAAGRSWFANCAWDAFGVCVALGSDGEISSACQTAASRSRSPSARAAPTPTSTSPTCSCRQRAGGTTSSSPEARSTSSGRRST